MKITALAFLLTVFLKQTHGNELKVNYKCLACNVVAGVINYILDNNPTAEECIADIAVEVCIVAKIEDEHVCKAAVAEYAREVVYIFSKAFFNKNVFCGNLLKLCPYSGTQNLQNWTLPIPGNKPTPTGYKIPDSSKPKLKVLHLTDIHFDSEYAEGSEADCVEPLCCRPSAPKAGPNGTVKVPAGKWGSNTYRCDVPLRTLESALAYAKNNLEVDMIVWTGDLVAHDIWEYTREHHLWAFKKFTSLMLKYFPDTPTFSATGNHEGVPTDQFPRSDVPARFSHDWLYSAFARNWSALLHNSNIIPDVLKRASFVTKPFPGLRIVSLNTIYAYDDNFWVKINSSDPDGTLAWFIQQLDQAEKAGDKVWILGHIPPDSTLYSWSKVYYDTINRYEDTVRGQFFGHTHTDELRVHYLNADPMQRATAVSYVNPSITTYSGRNPAFRIYTVDGLLQQVLDTETWYMNLTEANANGGVDNPQWQLEYRASTAYQLQSLTPQDWSALTFRMQNDASLVQKYYNYEARRNDRACNADCAKNVICSIRSALNRKAPGAQQQCEGIHVSGPNFPAFNKHVETPKLREKDLTLQQYLQIIEAVSKLKTVCTNNTLKART